MRLDEHPVLTGDMTENQLRYLAYAGLVINLLLYYNFFPRCFILAPFIALNWTFYSHPKVLAKARPITGTTLHLIGGILQLLLGYVVVAGFDLKGLLISVYFALVFSAGHLNHEVKDHDADLEAGLRTNAIVFGPRKMLSFAFLVFSFAFVYLFLITLAGPMGWSESWPFLAIYPVHLILHRRMMDARSPEAYDVAYQRNYRLLFLVAGLILTITKLIETF
jgi:4-hydroxybenzoate polyprenyltransferase